jgi:hypothetical protein
MTLKRSAKILSTVIGVIVIATIIVRVIDAHERPKNIAMLLNISSPPKSMKVVDCSSAWVPTDVVVVCAIEIDPKEFHSLLKGYEFTQTQAGGTSHTEISEKVGRDFSVAFYYVAKPDSFKHGGQITIIADKEKRNAVIDYYEE